MKQPAFLRTLIALGITLAATVAFAPGCGGDAKPGETGAAGEGGSTTTTTETGGTGGSTTATGNPQCALLCDHLADIDCNIVANCVTDCENHLNAKPECVDEADALIDCWVEHLADFMCTQQQLLPPAACDAQEKAFNTCVKGGMIDASCICSAGVGGGDKVTNCTRKTTCSTVEFVQTCKVLTEGEPWTCSCFANGGLLGTCTEEPEFEHCSNQYGCCVPLFCAASGE